jgi:hypothetical protein
MVARVVLGHLLDNFEDSRRLSSPSGALLLGFAELQRTDRATIGGRNYLSIEEAVGQRGARTEPKTGQADPHGLIALGPF